MKRPYCTNCGSEEVAVDATAEWDFDAQEWVLDSTFDHAYCGGCDGHTIDFKEVEE